MNGKRWLVLVGVVFALLLGGAGVALLVILPKYVESKVVSTAHEQGVELEPGEISFGWGWVQVDSSKVQLDRVRSIQAQLGRMAVTLDGLTPLAIDLTNVDVLVTGSVTNVALELSEWTKAHPSAYALPLSAKNVHARFIEASGSAPWLDVAAGSLTHTATGGVFAAEHATFEGVDLGRVGAGFVREASSIALGFGESDLGHAPLRIEVSPALTPPTATITLAPTAAEKLAKPLGMPLTVTGVTVSSQTTLSFPGGPLAGVIEGATTVNLKGYVPPHPFELDGFIFGDLTTFSSNFSIPAIRDRIALKDTKLVAGKFQLVGDGLLVRGSDHSSANLQLHGSLPCSALAGVEAESRLGKILGAAAGAKGGEVARQLINGSVAVGLKISVDTRNLAGAKLERSIGVGCGIHPLSLAELEKLFPLPPGAADLLANLPSFTGDLSALPALPNVAGLPSSLPPLPSGLPGLPAGLPKLPTLTLPDLTPPASSSTSKPKTPATKTTSAKPASSG